MSIEKSSRHQKIIGDFGENLICNWLSRSGFEVTIVDHTGIDIVAYKPTMDWRIGISVKSRTRNVGKEETTVNLIEQAEDIPKIKDACKVFACEPWMGIYIETDDYSDLFLIRLEHLLKNYSRPENKLVSWKMRDKDIQTYLNDPNIYHLGLCFKKTDWFE